MKLPEGLGRIPAAGPEPPIDPRRSYRIVKLSKRGQRITSLSLSSSAAAHIQPFSLIFALNAGRAAEAALIPEPEIDFYQVLYVAQRHGAMSGSIFETFVVSEILKSYSNSGNGTEGIYYYRDKDKKEIDLLIESGNIIHPIEIKKSGSINRDWIKNFNVLEKIPGKQVGLGAVICLAENCLPVNDNVYALPIEYI